MAKTHLDIESAGWEALKERMLATVAAGEVIVAQNEKMQGAYDQIAAKGVKAEEALGKGIQARAKGYATEAGLLNDVKKEIEELESARGSDKALKDVDALNAKLLVLKERYQDIVKAASIPAPPAPQLPAAASAAAPGSPVTPDDAGAQLKAQMQALASAKAQLKTDALDLLQNMGALSAAEREAVEGMVALIDKYEQLVDKGDELDRIAAAQARNTAAGTTETKGLQQQIGLLEQLASRVALLNQKRQAQTTEAGLAKTNAELKKATEEYQRVADAVVDLTGKQVTAAVSLRTQLAEARKNAAAVAEQFGEDSNEALVAASSVAQLVERVDDFNKRVEALNPEAKLNAVVQTTSAIAGGFQGVQGVLALVGAEGEDVQKTLLKVNAVMAVAQGLNQFLSIFDALKNIRAVLLATKAVKEADAVVTATQTAGTVALAGAQGAAATTAGGLATGIKAVGAAMAANPILLAAGLLIGIAAALIAMGDDSEDTKKKVDDLITTMGRYQQIAERISSNKLRLQGLQNELDQLKSANTLANERVFLERQINLELTGNEDKIKAATTASEALSRQMDELRKPFEVKSTVAGVRAFDINDDDVIEQLAKLRTEQEKYLGEVEQLKEDEKAIRLKGIVDRQKLTNRENEEAAAARAKAREEALADARAEAAALLQAKADFYNALQTLRTTAEAKGRQRVISNLELDAAVADAQGQIQLAQDLRDRIIAIRQEQEEAELATMQQGLLRKEAMVALQAKMQEEAIKRLTPEQLNAELDKIIASQKIELPPEAQAQLKALLDGIRADAERARQTNAKKADDATRASYDQQTKDRLKFIDDQSALEVAEATQQKKGRDEILKILIKYAKQRQEILAQMGTIEASTEAANVGASIDAMEKELKDRGGFSLSKLFGVKAEDEQLFTDSLRSLASEVGAIMEDVFITQEQERNARHLQLIEDRISSTEDMLRIEAEFKKEGLTNSYDSEKLALKALYEQRQKAVKEQEALARRQQAIETGMQAINLVSAVAKLLNSGASGGVIGLAIAAAAIPFMYNLFNLAKGKAKSSTVATQAFRKGTLSVERAGADPGDDRVQAYVDEGEAILPRENNRDYQPMVKGIYTRKREDVRKGVSHVVKRHNFTLDEILEDLDIPIITDPRAPVVVNVMTKEASHVDRATRRVVYADAPRLMQLHRQEGRERVVVIDLGNDQTALRVVQDPALYFVRPYVPAAPAFRVDAVALRRSSLEVQARQTLARTYAPTMELVQRAAASADAQLFHREVIRAQAATVVAQPTEAPKELQHLVKSTADILKHLEERWSMTALPDGRVMMKRGDHTRYLIPLPQ